MATYHDVLAAVTALLAPLVEDGTFKQVKSGPGDQLNEFPVAWVYPGASNDDLDPGRDIPEELTVQTGAVRIYVNRTGLLPGDYGRAVALVQPVKEAFRSNRTLSGLVEGFDGVDRFQSAGNDEPRQDDEMTVVYVDVRWRAEWREPDTYPDEWM